MSWEEIGVIGEVVSALAVLITLLFLVTQMRSNTNAIRAQTVQELAKSRSEFLLAGAGSPEISGAYSKAVEQGFDSLNTKENFQLRSFVLAMIYTYKNAYDQKELGTLTESEWEEYRLAFHMLLQDQAPVREFWEKYNSFLPSSFLIAVGGRELESAGDT